MYDVWYASVVATHDFLSAADLVEICETVSRDYLPHNAALVAVDGKDRVIGFMEHADAEIVALFIDPAHRAKGLGRAFVHLAIARWGAVDVKVNVQNRQGVGFYEAMGFVALATSPTDDQGRPYPIVRMHRPAGQDAHVTAQITPRHDLSPDELDAIEDRLYGHNSAATGRDDAQGIGFIIHDAAGRMVAAAAGYTWSGTSELKQMWVDEAHRGRGHARALLNAFVAEARRRGVRRIWVASHDFQAPGMYEKAGFTRMAEFDGWPDGHVNVILCKTL